MLEKAFCMVYEAKFTEKIKEMRQAWSHTFLSLRRNSEHVDLELSGTGPPQGDKIFRFLNIHKKTDFYPNRFLFPEVHCMKYGIR